MTLWQLVLQSLGYAFLAWFTAMAAIGAAIGCAEWRESRRQQSQIKELERLLTL